MNVGIIGSGGREHAICYMLNKSKKVSKIFCLDTAQITWSPDSTISNLFGKYFNLANLFFIFLVIRSL